MDSLLQPLAETENQKFCFEMMKRLDIQRRNEHFCDVILEVDSGDGQARLKAHRIVLCAASPFFYNALNSDMKEKKEGVIRLPETSKAVMEELLEFVYTGHVDVTQHNAFDLLEMADFLVIPSLKALSSKFISQTLSLSNCLGAYYSAERYHCPELQKEARDFASANFMSLTESEDFLSLNIEQVEEWISSDEIKVKEEEDVFRVIVKWMERNDGIEDERFFELFRHVRILYLSRNFVFNVISHHSLVKKRESCTAFVLDAMKEVSSGTEECYFAQPPRSCLKMHEDALVVCGKKKTFCYLPSENKWREMADMLFERKFPSAMSACHGKLYNIGGNDPPDESTMGRYDPSANSWTPVQSYSDAVARKFAAVVNFQGYLFVIGGKNENGAIGNVNKYNPETNLWQEAAPLTFARSGICAVADRYSLFAIGGMSGGEFLDVVEKFDPERNCWSQIASTIERKALSYGAISRDKVFIFGGCTGFQRPVSGTNLIEMYDPALNEWTGIQSVGPPKHCFGVVTFKGEVFVIGKWTEDSSQDSYLKVYDVDENEWKPCASIPRGFTVKCLAPLRIPRDILRSCRVIQ